VAIETTLRQVKYGHPSMIEALPGLTVGGCFTTTGWRAISVRAAGAVAIVARQATAKTKITAVLMIITAALLCF
jgi:hypothetical protein